jgi:hypothetical protein
MPSLRRTDYFPAATEAVMDYEARAFGIRDALKRRIIEQLAAQEMPIGTMPEDRKPSVQVGRSDGKNYMPTNRSNYAIDHSTLNAWRSGYKQKFTADPGEYSVDGYNQAMDSYRGYGDTLLGVTVTPSLTPKLP